MSGAAARTGILRKRIRIIKKIMNIRKMDLARNLKKLTEITKELLIYKRRSGKQNGNDTGRYY